MDIEEYRNKLIKIVETLTEEEARLILKLVRHSEP